MTATLAYSPGYAIPLWLGPAQIRLWRHLDRMVGTRTHARSTVRAIALELGANPGTISRDLDALARLGFAIHDATWGRTGVRLWRVLSRGGRKGLDPARRRRALARMGVAGGHVDPRQLTIEALADHPAGKRDGSPGPTGAAVSPPAAAPVIHAPAEYLLGVGDAGRAPAGDAGTTSPVGPYQSVRCSCGRSRIVRTGEALPECPHGAPAPADPHPTAPDPTPAQSVPCLDYQAHRHAHAYRDGRWICGRCTDV